MSRIAPDLASFLAAEPNLVAVSIATAKGSSPREAGARMLVGRRLTYGTIGGGKLEFLATEQARAMLSGGDMIAARDVPLGPEIGQCCGGRVTLDLRRLDENDRAALEAEAVSRAAQHPPVLVFGAGHVGLALARQLALLPVEATVIDTRPDMVVDLPPGIAGRALPVPEQAVRDAQPNTAFVILTHDHGLDFQIAREALLRGDAAYVGMIGSKSKRGRFIHFMRDMGATRAQIGGLTCPIGAAGLGDKRPDVIAAFTAAEILAHFQVHRSGARRFKAVS